MNKQFLILHRKQLGYQFLINPLCTVNLTQWNEPTSAKKFEQTFILDSNQLKTDNVKSDQLVFKLTRLWILNKQISTIWSQLLNLCFSFPLKLIFCVVMTASLSVHRFHCIVPIFLLHLLHANPKSTIWGQIFSHKMWV